MQTHMYSHGGFERPRFCADCQILTILTEIVENKPIWIAPRITRCLGCVERERGAAVCHNTASNVQGRHCEASLNSTLESERERGRGWPHLYRERLNTVQ